MAGPEIRRLYYSTQEVCDLLQVRPYDLKQWEKKFSELNPSAGKTGRRLYKPKDLEIVRHIKALIEKGHADDEIDYILNHPDTALLIQKSAEENFTIHDIVQELKDILLLLDSGKRSDTDYESFINESIR